MSKVLFWSNYKKCYIFIICMHLKRNSKGNIFNPRAKNKMYFYVKNVLKQAYLLECKISLSLNRMIRADLKLCIV